MDYIDKHLASGSVNERYSPSIRAAMAIGKTILNKYYTLTDNSEVYRIAMGMLFLLYDRHGTLVQIYTCVVLDPKRKLEYFRSAGWEEAWITTARDIVATEFEQGYSHITDDTNEEEIVSLFLSRLYCAN